MSIHADWYIHNLAILARVTGTASKEDVARLDFELGQLLNSATRPAIMLLHFDTKKPACRSLFKIQRIKNLHNKLIRCLVCCGNIEDFVAQICASPEDFGFTFDGQLVADWDSAIAYLLRECEKLTPLDIENADDLFNLNHGELL